MQVLATPVRLGDAAQRADVVACLAALVAR
jgi:hypothetical protein